MIATSTLPATQQRRTTAALAACDDAPSPLAPASDVQAARGGAAGKPGSAETVLFSGSVNGNMDIYAMNPDGTNLRRITTDTAEDIFPDFAPDNRKIVWVRHVGLGLSELFTASADGGRVRQLTTIGTYVMQPRYSPDGSKIAFVASVVGGGFEIFTANADGTGIKRLTYAASDESSPTWSPDGTRIAYQSNGTPVGLPFVFVMNADGLDVHQLEGCDFGACGEPAWSPDGTYIAVTGPGGAVFAVNIAGERVTRRASARRFTLSHRRPAAGGLVRRRTAGAPPPGPAPALPRARRAPAPS